MVKYCPDVGIETADNKEVFFTFINLSEFVLSSPSINIILLFEFNEEFNQWFNNIDYDK